MKREHQTMGESIVMIFAVLAVLGGSFSSARADSEEISVVTCTGVVQPIAVIPERQDHPVISGNWVVWMDNRGDSANGDIFAYNLLTKTEQQITFGTYPEPPAISRNKIVWSEWSSDGGREDIYLYDLSTKQKKRITNDSASQRYPDIDENLIVWVDDRNGSLDIFVHNLITKKTQQITTMDVVPTIGEPAISGRRIVWEEWRDGNSHIFLYDLTTKSEKQVTTDSQNHRLPSISGHWVVYKAYHEKDVSYPAWEIYLYDLTTNIERRITYGAHYQEPSAPQISGDTIVWEESSTDGKGGHIYLYEIALEALWLLTGGASSQIFPDISGNRVVWQNYVVGEVGGEADIYMVTLPPRGTMR